MRALFEDRDQIARALAFRGQDQVRLFDWARASRHEAFGDRGEVRSVIEYSNVCEQHCRYCGMNAASGIKRFVLSETEFDTQLQSLRQRGRRVIMVQTGESSSDRHFEKLCRLLGQAKKKHPEVVLLGALGCLSPDRYRRLREAGVGRYMLKFETSDPALYSQLRPSLSLDRRLDDIALLKQLGFQVSSGNITGLPGQSIHSLVDDLLLIKSLDIPMGSTSPFIPNDHSELAQSSPADINLTLNFMAILRILCPRMLIPTTSALELLAHDGQYSGLMAGANTITLHDGTPANKERDYVLYRGDRFLPREDLLDVAGRAGLTCSNEPLIAEPQWK